MRVCLHCSALLLLAAAALAQGTATPNPSQSIHSADDAGSSSQTMRSVSATSPSTFDKMSALVKRQVNKAIDSNPYPDLTQWHALTAREKFDIFLARTHSPRTFEETGVDALKDDVMNHNSEYERGFRGLGQRYGVNLGTSETGVFFEQFLVPSILKQDPRYYRDPGLPFVRRALYSVSRVFITRADSGHQTINASRVLGGAASQSLADLYVPGAAQGLHPIADRVTFDLARDAVFNLVHEFWPDLRHKLLHR